MVTTASHGPPKFKQNPAQVQTKSGSLIRPIVNLIPVFESSVLGPEVVADTIACKRK